GIHVIVRRSIRQLMAAGIVGIMLFALQSAAAAYDDFSAAQLDEEKWNAPAEGALVRDEKLELTARAGEREASTEITSTQTVSGERFMIEANVVSVKGGQAFLGVRDKESRKLVRVVASDGLALHIDTTASGSFRRLYSAQ